MPSQVNLSSALPLSLLRCVTKSLSLVSVDCEAPTRALVPENKVTTIICIRHWLLPGPHTWNTN